MTTNSGGRDAAIHFVHAMQVIDPKSTASDMAHWPDGSLSTAIEDTQSAVIELRERMDRGDLHIIGSFMTMLAGLVRMIEIVKRSGRVDYDLDMLKKRLNAVEVIARASTTGDGVEQDNFQNHIRATSAIVQKVLNTVAVSAAQEPSDQPTTQDLSEIKDLLEILEYFLEVYHFDDNIGTTDRLAAVNQAFAKGPYTLRILNNNSNTTYNFGRDVVNNNWVQVFVFSSGTECVTPGLVKKQEQFRDIIRTALGGRFVLAAAYDTQPETAGCMPGTREAVLSKFMEWAREASRRIFWLAGLAGTGKTSIAITLCRMLHNDASVILGGAFFCSRTANSSERTDARCVLPTLAATFAEQSPGFAAELAKELKVDPRAAVKPIGVQIESLIRRPLAALASSSRPVIFVVDALDECSDEEELQSLLQALAGLRCAAKVGFILTSRPEMHISRSFIANTDLSSTLRLHTIDSTNVTEDIRLYIGDAFAKEKQFSWYTDADITALAAQAEGLFIFAATIIKYVLGGMTPNDRMQRLRNILLTANPTAATTRLDAVYRMVLTRAASSAEVDPREVKMTLRVLVCILAARMPLSVRALAELLGQEPEELRGSLGRLHSVVNVPERTDQAELRTLHASFGDYLIQRLPEELHITMPSGHKILAHACINIMATRLHINISKTSSSYAPNPAASAVSIGLSVQYACLQWIFHMFEIAEPSQLDHAVNDVFKPNFLFWLEVMSVIGRVRRCTAMLIFAAAIVRSADASRFLRDAISFVTSSRKPIELSAPHIYLSALPFAAKDSSIYKTFAPLCTGMASVDVSGLIQHGGRHVMTLSGHEAGVTSVSYSPDGLLVASGSRDGTVRIWDMRAGEETMSPLRSDDGPVLSVAFSPNGRVIGSGTAAGLVCIWTISAGRAALQRLRGHTGAVSSVAFRADGCLIASGSRDMTVRLWSLDTCQETAILKAHVDWVNSVAFSPDGLILASSSDDAKIHIWDSSSGIAVGEPLCDHFFPGFSLSFSPDGQKIASGSVLTARLWETHSGKFISALHGHSGEVRCVQVSPDGQSLVTAADDRSVRLWNLRQDPVHDASVVLDGHTAGVCSAAFSPDGFYVASASEDCTIRIWDARSSQMTVANPLWTHSDRVNSVVVSPDSAFIISGSADGSVRVWDRNSGEARHPPLLGHEHSVTSVDISSDGRLIASASLDRTVRLWNPQNGAAIGMPLRGHGDDVRAVKFSPNSKFLASGARDESVRIWDVENMRQWEFGALGCHREVNCVAFSRDSKYIAAGDSGGAIYYWKLDIPSCEPLQTAQTSVCSISFSLDGSLIAAGGCNMECSIWHVNERRQIRVLRGHTDRLTSLAYSPQGRYICTGSVDQTVCLWEAGTGTLIATLRGHASAVKSVAFTPDSRCIVSSSNDKTIRVWDVDAAHLSLTDDRTRFLLPSGDISLGDPVNVTFRDGWLRGPSDQLIMWVPAEYHPHLPAAPCTLRIEPTRVIIFAGKNAMQYGATWSKCWI